MKKDLYLKDEPFVASWEHAQQGDFPVFGGVTWNEYPSMRAFLHQSFGGRIPVLHVKDRAEFEHLIRAIFYKGAPKPIPASMGALAIKGWKDDGGCPHRAIILSDGYYSAVPPEEMGLCAEEWKEKSFQLRLAHECAHYYTLRAFGFMKTGIRDEMIADAMGIVEAFGIYKAEWFLRFMGLEDYPKYRPGGRLENYLPKDQTVDEEKFQELLEVIVSAAKHIETYTNGCIECLKTDEGKLALLHKLAENDEILFLEEQPWRTIS